MSDKLQKERARQGESKERARQGESHGHVWKILLISLGVLVVAMAIIYFYVLASPSPELADPVLDEPQAVDPEPAE